MPDRDVVLILGGTAEAKALAAALAATFGERLRVISSLAGVTLPHSRPTGETRIGSFNGIEGLAAYLRDQRVDAVIDATHPFAATMSRHARLACAATGVRRLTLHRPPWRRDPADRWTEAADMAEAARILPGLGRRAFLTIGTKHLSAFSGVAGMWFLVRLLATPTGPLPLADHSVTIGGDDADLMVRHAIDVLVTKASGGPATEGKILAARKLALPVVMIRRPPPEPGDAVDTVADAVRWLAGSG